MIRCACGEVSLSSGTHDLQMSYPLLAMHRMEYCFRWVWKAVLASLVFIHTPDHMSLWHLYMVTLASVADPRLFDPRVGDDKTYITTMSMQQTSVHGRTTSRHKTGWEDRTWGYPSLSSGCSTCPYKEFLPGSPLSHLYYRSRNKDLSLVSGMCIVAITI